MEVFESEPQDTSLGFSIPGGYTLTFIYIFFLQTSLLKIVICCGLTLFTQGMLRDKKGANTEEPLSEWKSLKTCCVARCYE